MSNKRKLLVLLGCILIIGFLAMNGRIRKSCIKTWNRVFGKKTEKKITKVEKKTKFWKSQNDKKKPSRPPTAPKPKVIVLSSDTQPTASPSPKKTPAKPEKTKEKTPALHVAQKSKSSPNPVPRKPEDDTSPFNYGAEELGGYVPLKGQRLLTDIRIKGILELAGKEPVAVLELRNSNKTFYVKKDDVIRLNEGNGKNKGIAEVYLQVVSISKNEVEIIQQQRPDKVIIVR